MNNAGLQRLRLAVDVTEEDWDAVHETNLRGPFFVAHIVYGLVFGLVAFPFLARRERTTKL